MVETSQTPAKASIPSLQSFRQGDGLSVNWCRWCGSHLDPITQKQRNFCGSSCLADMLNDTRQRAADIRARGRQTVQGRETARAELTALRREVVALRQLTRKYYKRGL